MKTTKMLLLALFSLISTQTFADVLPNEIMTCANDVKTFPNDTLVVKMFWLAQPESNKLEEYLSVKGLDYDIHAVKVLKEEGVRSPVPYATLDGNFLLFVNDEQTSPSGTFTSGITFRNGHHSVFLDCTKFKIIGESTKPSNTSPRN